MATVNFTRLAEEIPYPCSIFRNYIDQYEVFSQLAVDIKLTELGAIECFLIPLSLNPENQKKAESLIIKGFDQKIWRRRRESNSRIQVLQTRALPLGYSALDAG